jgi:hypothetical protein
MIPWQPCGRSHPRKAWSICWFNWPALWAELVPDLDELDKHGGGDYDMDADVSSWLGAIEQLLSRTKIEAKYRHERASQNPAYIQSGNAGLDEELDAVAYATCYNNADWRLWHKPWKPYSHSIVNKSFLSFIFNSLFSC